VCPHPSAIDAASYRQGELGSPSPYTGSVSCGRQVVAAHGQRIRLTFTRWDVYDQQVRMRPPHTSHAGQCITVQYSKHSTGQDIIAQHSTAQHSTQHTAHSTAQYSCVIRAAHSFCRAAQCSAVQRSVVQRSVVQRSVVQCSAAQCSAGVSQRDSRQIYLTES
jgi:hypothetical protein